MNTQSHDQRAYRAAQLAHHMRRLSETTAAHQYNLNIDISSLPFILATPSYSSSSSSDSKGEVSPLSDRSEHSENPLHTPRPPDLLSNSAPSTMPAMFNAYDGLLPFASASKNAANPLYANPMLYEDVPLQNDLFPYQPIGTSFTGIAPFMSTSSIFRPFQAQVPDPSYHPYGNPLPFSSYSFDPSYRPEPCSTFAHGAKPHLYGIDPQALSLDPLQNPSNHESPPSPAAMFNEPLTIAPTHNPTPSWSPDPDVSSVNIPRAASVSFLSQSGKPRPPKLRRHSDSYTSDHYSRNTAGPAKKGRKRKSGWSVDASIESEGVMDKKERRKIQNRMAQRAFRARMKAHKD